MAQYDNSLSLYDSIATYDGGNNAVQAIFSHGWTLEPLPSEDEMAQTLNYELKLQQLDEDQNIIGQAEVDASISIPNDISGDDKYQIAAGAIDQSLPLNSSYVDFVLLTSGSEYTVKFNQTTGTPFTPRQDGSILLDVKNITAVYISNPGLNPIRVRMITAVRQTPSV
jgi:hypothetical protein